MKSDDAATTPFVAAVAEQAAHRLGWRTDIADSPLRELAAREVVQRLLTSAAAEGPEHSQRVADAALELAGSAPLLAAFFQNIDLLFAHGSSFADPVARLLGRALEYSAGMRAHDP